VDECKPLPPPPPVLAPRTTCTVPQYTVRDGFSGHHDTRTISYAPGGTDTRSGSTETQGLTGGGYVLKGGIGV
jgi:hypothetical protein